MVSLPSYDPNLFVNGISHTDYRALMDNPSRPQFNRNVLGGVAPGSTHQAADRRWPGLDSGLRTPRGHGALHRRCSASPARRRGWRDAAAAAHGWTDLRKSISRLGQLLLLQARLRHGHRAVRPVHAPLRLRRADRHRPARRDRRHRAVAGVQAQRARANRWYPGETVIAGIGQGYWKVTALQLARGTAAHRRRRPAARACTWSPARRDGFDAPWTPRAAARRRCASPTTPRTCARCRKAWSDHPRPAAPRTAMAIGAPYRMAGKTGTAQVISRSGSASIDPQVAALSPAPPGAVRRLRAGRQPDHRDGGGGRARRLRRHHRRADRAQDLRCLAAGQDAARPIRSPERRAAIAASSPRALGVSSRQPRACAAPPRPGGAR